MGEMTSKNSMQLFEDRRIRTAWDVENEEWYFSIVDVCEVLTDTANPRRYWSDLKRKLKKEGAIELYEKIVQLKMPAPDGKNRFTDVANMEQLLRIIQSIPSPKAEPFKIWLAQVGKELADEWHDRGVQKGMEYAILTDEISRAWSGMTTRQYKGLKGLKKENLRDNMSTTELVLNMLAETSTTDISKVEQPEGFAGNKQVARMGGEVAGIARKALEERTGKSVITSKNALDFRKLITDIVEDTSTLQKK